MARNKIKRLEAMFKDKDELILQLIGIIITVLIFIKSNTINQERYLKELQDQDVEVIYAYEKTVFAVTQGVM